MQWSAWLVIGSMLAGGAAAAHGAVRWGGDGEAPVVAQLREMMGEKPLPDPPTAQDALTRLTRYESIQIRAREDFHPENGVRGGSGTRDDPFLFEGFYADRMTIEDVEAHYLIRDAYIRTTLRLDYTGAGARVESSTIGFFLTDTNRPHTAPHTWLDVRGNDMGAARIRHAGGHFMDNTIGAPGAFDPDRLALEVQGYNGLHLARNVVHGPVEFRLHGHHYAASYEAGWSPMAGHDHGDPATRYHEVRVEDNEFRDASGRGVAISDRDHAGNHATAKSAPDPRLDEAHAHHLRFHFERNRLYGAGLVIEKANAVDPKHTGGSATIVVARNELRDPLAGTGIAVLGAKGARIELVDDRILMGHARLAGSSGILLQNLEGGEVVIRGGEIRGFDRGVRAAKLDASATWSVDGVAFHDVAQGVWWDRSVKSPPKGNAAPAPASDPHAGHAGHK